MLHRDVIILQKVIAEIDIAIEMLGNADLSAFLADEKLKRAIAMTVINIGELVKNITEETRLNNPVIPWKSVAGMRDIAAHKYQTLRMEDVYQTVVTDFKDLRIMIEKNSQSLNAILTELYAFFLVLGREPLYTTAVQRHTPARLWLDISNRDVLC